MCSTEFKLTWDLVLPCCKRKAAFADLTLEVGAFRLVRALMTQSVLMVCLDSRKPGRITHFSIPKDSAHHFAQQQLHLVLCYTCKHPTWRQKKQHSITQICLFLIVSEHTLLHSPFHTGITLAFFLQYNKSNH